MERVTLILCLAALVAPALAAQEAPAPNAHQQAKGDFAFWAEMPDVAQVINDVQGKDAEDIAARQLAAYRLLEGLVSANADRIGQLPWPPREAALNNAYTRLIYKRVRPNESGPRDRRIMAQSYRFDSDTAFTQPFLKRYFSQAALRDIEPIVTRIEADARIGAADAQLQINQLDSVAEEQAVAQERIPPASSVMPPGYLEAMPTVDRVLADMKVADSVESRARQYTAVSYLHYGILFLLTEDHRRSGLTPEESRLEREYLDAEKQLRSGWVRVPGLNALINRYQAEVRVGNAPFHHQLLDRYFSPAWKAAFLTLEQAKTARERAAIGERDSIPTADVWRPRRIVWRPLRHTAHQSPRTSVASRSPSMTGVADS